MRIHRNLTLFLIFVFMATLIQPSSASQKSTVLFSNGTIYYPQESNNPPPEEFSKLHIEGKNVKNEAGQTVFLQGANVYAAEWSIGNINNQQFSYMKDWGFNVIRITIPRWTILGGRWQNSAFVQTYLDMIQYAKDHEMYVVISIMHLDDEDASQPFSLDTSTWSASDWNEYIQHITYIVSLTKDENHVLYDLLNEPLYLQSYNFYRDKMEQAIDAVRSVDPDAVCIVEAGSLGYFGDTIFGLYFFNDYPIRRENIIYSGHIYQWVEWEASSDYTIEAIRARFQLMDWYNVLDADKPVWIGEFNSQNSLIGDPTYKGEEFLRNLMTSIAEDGFSGWCAWAWGPIGRHQLINDYAGTPSPTGQTIKEYLMEN